MTQIQYASGRRALPSPGVLVESGGSVPPGTYFFWLQAKNRVGYNEPSAPREITLSQPGTIKVYVPGISWIEASEDWREYVLYGSTTSSFSSSVPIGLFELYNSDGVTTKALPPNNFNSATPPTFLFDTEFLYNPDLASYEDLDPLAPLGRRFFVQSLSQVYEKRETGWRPVNSNKIVEDVANFDTEVIFVDESEFNISVIDYLSQPESWIGFYVIPRNSRPLQPNTRLTFQLFVDNENYTLRIPDAIEYSVEGIVNLTSFSLDSFGITLPGIFRKYDPFTRNLFIEKTVPIGSAYYVKVRLNLQPSDFISRDIDKSKLKVLPVFNAEYFANYFDGNLFVGNVIFNSEERCLLEPRGKNTVYIGSGSGCINATTFRNRPSQLLTGFPSNTNIIPVYMNLIGDCYLGSRFTANQVQRAIVSTAQGYSLPAPFTAQRVLGDDWTVTLELTHRPDKISSGASDLFLRDRENIQGGSTTDKVVIIMRHSILGLRAAQIVINPTASTTTVVVGGDLNWQPYPESLLTLATRNLFKPINVGVLSEGTGSPISGGVVSFSYAYYYDGTVISDINHSPLLGNIVTQNLSFAELSISYEFFGNPVRTLSDLASIGRDNRRDLQIRVVNEGGAAYIYDSENFQPHNGSTIIRPSDVTVNQGGRWRRLNSTQWFTGQGNPNPSVGSILDFYVDTNSYRLWQKKSLTTWEFQANLRQKFLIFNRDPNPSDNSPSIYSVNDLWFSSSSRKLFYFSGAVWTSNNTDNKLGDRLVTENRDPYPPAHLLPKGDLWLNYSSGTLFRQEGESRNLPNWVPIGTFRIEGARWLVGNISEDSINQIYYLEAESPHYPIGALNPNTEVFNGSLLYDQFTHLPLEETEVPPLPNDMAVHGISGAIYRRGLTGNWDFIYHNRGTRVYYGNIDPRTIDKFGSPNTYIQLQDDAIPIYGAFCFGDIFHNLNTGDVFIHTGAYKRIDDTSEGNESWVLVGNSRYIGTQFFMENGLPSPSLGLVNDLYMDNQTKKIYLKTTDGWEYKTTLRPTSLSAEGVLPKLNKGLGDLNLNPNTGVISEVVGFDQSNEPVWVDKGSIRVHGSIHYFGEGHPEMQNANHPSRQALTGDNYFDTLTGNLYRNDYPNLYTFVDAGNQTINTPWKLLFSYNPSQFFVGFGEPTATSFHSGLSRNTPPVFVDFFLDIGVSLNQQAKLAIKAYADSKGLEFLSWKGQNPVSSSLFGSSSQPDLTGGYFPINIILSAQPNPAENGFYVVADNSDLGRNLSELRQFETPNDPIGLVETIFIGPLQPGVGLMSYFEAKFITPGNPVVGETGVGFSIATPDRYDRVDPRSYQSSRYITNLRNIVDPLVPYKTSSDSLGNSVYFDMNQGNFYKATYFEGDDNFPEGYYWQIKGSLARKGNQIVFFKTIHEFETGEYFIVDVNGNPIPNFDFHENSAIGDLLYNVSTNTVFLKIKGTSKNYTFLNNLLSAGLSSENYQVLHRFEAPSVGRIDSYALDPTLQSDSEGKLFFNRLSEDTGLPLVEGATILQYFDRAFNRKVVMYQVLEVKPDKVQVAPFIDYTNGINIKTNNLLGTQPFYEGGEYTEETSFESTNTADIIFDVQRGVVLAPKRIRTDGVNPDGTVKYVYRNQVIGSFQGSRIFVGETRPSEGYEAFLQQMNSIYREWYGDDYGGYVARRRFDFYFCTSDETLYRFGEGGSLESVAQLSGTIWRSGEGVPTLFTPGKDNDFYLDRLEGKLYQKINGIYQYASNLHIYGNTKFFVEGIPNNSLGDDGDIAIETLSRFAYIKENGGWVFKTSLRGTNFVVGETIPTGTTLNLTLPSNVYPNPYEGDMYFCVKNRNFYKAYRDLNGQIYWSMVFYRLTTTIHRIDNKNRINLSSGDPINGVSVLGNSNYLGFHAMPGDLVLDDSDGNLYVINNTFDDFDMVIESGADGNNNLFLGVFGSSESLPSDATNGQYAFVLSSSALQYYTFTTQWNLQTSLSIGTGGGSGEGLFLGVFSSSEDLPSDATNGQFAFVLTPTAFQYYEFIDEWNLQEVLNLSRIETKVPGRLFPLALSTDSFGNPVFYDYDQGQKAILPLNTGGCNTTNGLVSDIKQLNDIQVNYDKTLLSISGLKKIQYLELQDPFECDQVLFWFDGTNKGDYELRSIFNKEFITSAYCKFLVKVGEEESISEINDSNLAIKDDYIGVFLDTETTIGNTDYVWLEQDCTSIRVAFSGYINNVSSSNGLILKVVAFGLTLSKVSASSFSISDGTNTETVSAPDGWVNICLTINSSNSLVEYPSIENLTSNSYNEDSSLNTWVNFGEGLILQHFSIVANPAQPNSVVINLFEKNTNALYHPFKDFNETFCQICLSKNTPTYLSNYGFDTANKKFDQSNRLVYLVGKLKNKTLEYTQPFVTNYNEGSKVIYLVNGGISVQNQNWIADSTFNLDSWKMVVAFKIPYFEDLGNYEGFNYYESLNLVEVVYRDPANFTYSVDSVTIPTSYLNKNKLIYFACEYDSSNNVISYTFNPFDPSSLSSFNVNSSEFHQFNFLNLSSYYQEGDSSSRVVGTYEGVYTEGSSGFQKTCKYDFHLYEYLRVTDGSASLKDMVKYLKRRWKNVVNTNDKLS